MNKGRKAFAKGMLGLALLGAVIYLANPVQLWGRLQQVNPWWLLAGFGFAIASNAVSAWRWRAMAVWLGAEMPMASAMLLATADAVEAFAHTVLRAERGASVEVIARFSVDRIF